MTLSIAATARSRWQQLKPALKVLGWTENQSNPEQWHPDTSTQAQIAQSTYLLLHTRPELALARALANGESLEQAYATWDATTDRLLEFYQKNRQRAAIVDAAAASEAPKTLITWLSDNHPAFADLTVPTELEAAADPEPADPICLLIAAQYLSGMTGLDSKLGRLEAMSIPLNEEGYVAPTIDLDGVLQSIQESPTDQKELGDTKAENELLILQLHQVQEELEELYLQDQKRKSDLKAATESLSSVKSELSKQQEQLKLITEKQKQDAERIEQLTTERDELETQLKDCKSHLALTQNDLQSSHTRAEQLQAELAEKQTLIDQQKGQISDKNRKLQKLSRSKKAVVEEAGKLRRDLKAAEHQQQVLKGELDHLHKSISWKLGSPVRAITGVAKLAHKPSRHNKAALEQARLIEDSDLFDAGWYLQKYPDVTKTPMSPAQHYLVYGAAEGRDPSEHFSTKWYIKKYQDVAQSGINPLLHYILYGKEEGRKPAPKSKV